MPIFTLGLIVVPWITRAAARLFTSEPGPDRPSSTNANPAEGDEPSPDVPSPVWTDFSQLRLLCQNNGIHCQVLGSQEGEQEEDNTSTSTDSVVHRIQCNRSLSSMPPPYDTSPPLSPGVSSSMDDGALENNETPEPQTLTTPEPQTPPPVGNETTVFSRARAKIVAFNCGTRGAISATLTGLSRMTSAIASAGKTVLRFESSSTIANCAIRLGNIIASILKCVARTAAISNFRTTAFGFLCKLAAVLRISIFTSFVGITKAVPILVASGALTAGSFLALKLPETRGQVLQ